MNNLPPVGETWKNDKVKKHEITIGEIKNSNRCNPKQ